MKYWLLLMFLLGCQAAAACNPAPPRPPILEGYRYDAMAAGALLRDADAVVGARLQLRIDTMLGPGEAPDQAGYVFEVIEGWKAVLPRRLTLSGVWVDCALPLETGQVFLLYLAGERLLHAVPAETLDFELDLLGDPAWFYDAGGRLVQDEAD
ncbi:hypothetical protein [Thioalkalivibrio sp. XN279]|uniref:hypothetical protein n=1 Tax=Thioalkalivibrio sp. XN279 TaxID=2714953 RepID=UPI00140A042E|nr:hypothetical protein [Thioalkalivibrio sp. XN279]NHA14064.1 hypothetical protein [Thioalkalivibrio sp. XN279]